ncbi:hypothetical protein Kisp01_71270 [Kineosporia sp. NBRC 101677]|uniref:DUF397 domain-containing protein n=1 Tax=Kineosporia sp. NBRC 101677 TaxID=3032197 RepID=UPI0024A5AC83|nr:DUF397 domain-containing protein [Kineosporia sp. NBRC 101677]GLY20113.1 hypothetical protein Kisp01_71270 [Kineosporia sp. NBRC 101677]
MNESGGWIKASASSGSGECVEMRKADKQVQVRDSKLGTSSPIHILSPAGFATWLHGAKNGEYDSLR